jgi:two-component system sensor histidine kinase RegB
MDKPLLALTRGAAPPPSGPSPESTAVENMRQLIQLRWIAVMGQTLTILFAHRAIGVTLPLTAMLGVAAFLAVANLLATMALARRRVHNGEVMLALLVDMAALTVQLYFSGGATNPFISLYLLQVVLGAILLPPALASLLAAAASFCYALLSVRYRPLELPRGLLGDSADVFAIGYGIAFVMVACLLVFFITRISRNLRARDTYLADMQRQAAEEEGIVRMGLFASGAAHELGTPLGTLAVILADWRRMPGVVQNPELLAEVVEMQTELERCKGIVSDILHSAGQPRGDAMESAAVEPFLDVVVDSWRATHASVPIAYCCAGLAGARTAVNPALRQAIWSILDNAAEASPQGISLEAAVSDDMLTIAIRDAGPGFPAKALDDVGKLYQSTKGAGHGLGLFLAANVARRLGGRLEARNLDDGGAEVRLLLPLATGSGGR